MRFKFYFAFLFFLKASALFAESRAVHPLGLVIRPNLVKKIVDELSRYKSEGKTLSFEICLNNRDYLQFDFAANWDQAKWINLSSTQVYLQTRISHFFGRGKYIVGCTVNRDTKAISVTAKAPVHARAATLEIDEAKLGVQVEAQNMQIQVDRSLIPDAAANMKISVQDAPNISAFLNSAGIRDAILNELFSLAQENISVWLKEKLRGLVFVQSAGEALKDNPIWKAGPLVETGAVTLELVDRNPAQQYLTFAFNPFRKNSSFSSTNGLELYFNATFLNLARIKELSGLDPIRQSSKAVLDRTRMALTNPDTWSDAEFERPNLSRSSSDFSLVIPTSLTNEAWATFYSEQLLKLRTTINIGKQTVGLIADEEQENRSVITINPKSAPKMHFEANKFKLEVEDYVMDLGNWIEDRIIPTTQIQSKVSVSASLKVDSKTRMVKMVLDPSKFELTLKDLKARFTDEEIALFQTMANTIWRDFFNTYAEFEIFPTIFDPGTMPLEIQDVSVNGSSVVIDVNLLFRGAKQ